MQNINRITEFLMKHSIHEDYVQTDTIVRLHCLWDTMIVVYDDYGEVSAVARWNIEDNIIHILEAIIRPDKRGNGIIKGMIKYGLMLNPGVTGLTWDRKRKYPESKRRNFKVKEKRWEQRK